MLGDKSGAPLIRFVHRAATWHSKAQISDCPSAGIVFEDPRDFDVRDRRHGPSMNAADERRISEISAISFSEVLEIEVPIELGHFEALLSSVMETVLSGASIRRLRVCSRRLGVCSPRACHPLAPAESPICRQTTQDGKLWNVRDRQHEVLFVPAARGPFANVGLGSRSGVFWASRAHQNGCMKKEFEK